MTVLERLYACWKKIDEFVWFMNEHKYGFSEDEL